MDIMPTTVIVGISEAITLRSKVTVLPHQAKFLGDFGMLLQAPGVTDTVVTGKNPGIRYHYGQVIHVPSHG